MGNGIIHKYVSAKPDSNDSSLVQPSNWNAEHVGGTGRSASYVIAAFDAGIVSKAQADVICTGTNDDAVIQSGITAIQSTGKGCLLLSEGNYNLNASVNLATGIDIKGVGRGTFVNTTGNFAAFKITGTSGTPVGDLMIRDLQITGSGKANTSNYGISITFGTHVWMQNLYFTKLYAGLYTKGTYFSTLSNFLMQGTGANQMEYGVLTDWQDATHKNELQLINGIIGNCNSNGVRMKGASGVHASDVIVVNTTGYGWYFGDESAGQYSEFIFLNNCDADCPLGTAGSGYVFIKGSADSFEGINISNCWAGGWGGYGMYFSGGVTNINISNPEIREVGSDGVNSSANGIKIMGGTIKGWDTANTSTKYAINFNGIASSVALGVQLDANGHSTAGKVRDSSGVNTIKFNPGYVTENSGASSGTGSQQTIAHGLSFTPTAQQIKLTAGSATANPYHSAAPNATNIYVTAASSQAWYWST